jgi:hypothetical protein
VRGCFVGEFGVGCEARVRLRGGGEEAELDGRETLAEEGGGVGSGVSW